MIKQKLWYILSGVLIAFLSIGMGIYMLNPALADDIFIPFTTGVEPAVDSADVVESEESALSTAREPEQSYPAPEARATEIPLTPPGEGYVRMYEVTAVPTEYMETVGMIWVDPETIVFIGETTAEPAPTMDPAQFQRDVVEMLENAPPAESGYYSGPETAGKTLVINGQEITLPSNTYVSAYTVAGTCLILPDSVLDDPHRCGELPIYTLQQGENRVHVEQNSGKISYDGRQNAEELQSSQKAFQWLEEELTDSTILIRHGNGKYDIKRLGRDDE
ncbi:MAG: hypothetical protein AAF702_44085 [Chloroflexota bacterium]